VLDSRLRGNDGNLRGNDGSVRGNEGSSQAFFRQTRSGFLPRLLQAALRAGPIRFNEYSGCTLLADKDDDHDTTVDDNDDVRSGFSGYVLNRLPS
jgi:hypothetical protein